MGRATPPSGPTLRRLSGAMAAAVKNKGSDNLPRGLGVATQWLPAFAAGQPVALSFTDSLNTAAAMPHTNGPHLAPSWSILSNDDVPNDPCDLLPLRSVERTGSACKALAD